MPGIIKSIAPEANQAPSQYCRYFFRGEQSTGDLENKVEGAALGVKNAGFLDATLWANAGYATVGGAAANYCTLAASTHDLTLSSQNSLVIALRVKKVAVTLPAAEQYMVASYNPGSNTGGIIISCRPDGAARIYLNATDGTTVNVSSAANTICNGTVANERSIVLIVPREGGSAYMVVDALTETSSSAASLIGKSLIGGRDMRIGGPLSGSATDAYQLAAVSAYQVPVDGASLNRRLIGDWAMRNPGTPMPDWVFA